MKRALGILVFISMAAAVCSAQVTGQTTSYLPQIADGVQAGGYVWTTAIAITNPAAVGSAAASGSIVFTQSNGTAFNVPFMNLQGQAVGSGNSVPFQLSGGQTFIMISTGVEALNVGFATITSSLPVIADAVFEENGPDPDCPSCGTAFIAQAGVPLATPSSSLGTLVIESNHGGVQGSDTALAIANPGTSTANLTFQLLNTDGTVAYPSVTATLAAKNQTAEYVSQLFPAAAAGSFVGEMVITSSSPVVLLPLAFKSSGEFGTLLVFAVQ